MVRPGIGGWQLRRWQSTAETDRLSNLKILGYCRQTSRDFFDGVFVVVGLLRWRKTVPNVCRVFYESKFSYLGVFWRCLGCLEGVLEGLGGVLGASWGIFGGAWGVLRVSWWVSGASWEPLGGSLGCLGRV